MSTFESYPKDMLYSLQKNNYKREDQKTSFSITKNIDTMSPFKDLMQNRMIDNCFGQLSSSDTQNHELKHFSLKFKKMKERKPKICQRLPPLANPGSNMNNAINTKTAKKIGSINLEPLANAEELISLNPMNNFYDENYNKSRVFFMLSTFMCVLIILFEIIAILLGIIYSNSCQMVDVFLIVSGCFHIIIILMEWAKSWIWSSQDNPVVPDSNSDHMQICLSCILIALYSFCIIWYTVGFAWIPTVFANFMKQRHKHVNEIIIIKNGIKYVQHIPKCTENFYVFALSYQVIIGLVFLLRVILCCLSDFCRGLYSKFASHSTGNEFKLYSENPLNTILPPIRDPLFKFGFRNNQNETGLNTLINVNKLCMISPIPVYSGDMSRVNQNLEAPLRPM